MMKDYANPLLLLIILVLMACQGAVETAESQNVLELWALALCVTGLLVDGALALAKSLAQRRPLMNVVWAVVFLVLGCCAWTLRSAPLSEEQLAYRDQKAAEPDPLARDAEGETLLARAAALGKVREVKSILNNCAPTEEHLCEAGFRAAENNHTAVLDALARLGMPANAKAHGIPLLHAAAQSGACEAMEWLIMRGARINERDDAEGSTALIQATLAESLPAVKLLLQHGADVRLRDAAGRSAADFARTEEMETLLTPKTKEAPQPPPAP